jgi:S1-C subfamily serine protease
MSEAGTEDPGSAPDDEAARAAEPRAPVGDAEPPPLEWTQPAVSPTAPLPVVPTSAPVPSPTPLVPSAAPNPWWVSTTPAASSPPPAPSGPTLPPGGPPPWAGRPGGWGGGPGGWTPGAPPSPPSPAPGPSPRRLVAAIVAAALVLGSGLGLGALLHDRSSAGRSSSSTLSIDNSSRSGVLDLSAVSAKVNPAIVNITSTLTGVGEAAGTGMVITSSGEVLTNNHVIDGATTINVEIGGNGSEHSATVLGYDRAADIALLKIDGVSGLKTITAGDPSKVAVNDPIAVIGNALGRGGAPTVSQGVVAALDQTVTASDDSGGNLETLDGMIRIQAPIQPGDSGGALVDASSRVIGMNTAAAQGRVFRDVGSNIGFAIPIDRAFSVARQIESGKSTATVHVGSTGILGVHVQDATGARGALVVDVQSDTPARSAGLAANDVIVSIDGKSVTSSADLAAVLSGYHARDKVTVAWLDSSGQRHTATVQLVNGPPR